MLNEILNLAYSALAVVGLAWWAVIIVCLAAAAFGVTAMLLAGDLAYDQPDLSKIHFGEEA